MYYNMDNDDDPDSFFLKQIYKDIRTHPDKFTLTHY